MNPFFQQILGAIARTAIVWIAGRLGQTVSEDQIVQIIAVYVVPGAMLAWSLYQKYHGRQKLLTALASSKAMTEHEVEQAVATTPAPSVLTPKTSLPQ